MIYKAKIKFNMKILIAKYFSLASIMATIAWFFWNPVGWSFEWEPIVVFLASLGVYFGCDWTAYSKAMKSDLIAASVHPSDRFLLKKIVKLLPSTGVIHFLKHHDFLGSFRQREIEPIEQFLYEWNNAEHEFQDEDIEKLKIELFEAARQFIALVGQYTTLNKNGFQAVRPDYYEGGGEREVEFRREANEIGKSADSVVEKHQEFVRVARHKFGD